MKPTATLTNIARGGIVDDAALAQALRQGTIAAAGLDVFEGEPRIHPDLLAVDNIVLTPHIGSASVNTRRAMAALTVDNLIAALGYGPQARPTADARESAGAAAIGRAMQIHKVMVMGVAGCGKSTLAARLATALDAEWIEADDHTIDAGTALAAAPGNAVLACPALKRSDREQLRTAVPQLRIVYVDITLSDAIARGSARGRHLFAPSRVLSQFAILETPAGEPGVLQIPADQPVDTQVRQVLRWITEDTTRQDNDATQSEPV